MSQSKLLKKLVDALEAMKVPYMLTGSVVSSYYGEPRSTHDIDVVLIIDPSQIPAIQAQFNGDDYAFDEVAAAEAIARHDQFQLHQFSTGDKIDFWSLSNDEFQRNQFSRRVPGLIQGIQTWCPTPEDNILQKLSWAHLYQSDRQYNDALSVYELQFRRLDLTYMNLWVDRLDIRATWDRMLSEAEPLS